MSMLVAGIGNVFAGDDGFGVEVVRRLIGRGLPADVTAVDFGTRGVDLAFAIGDGYSAVLLVDACPRGGAPGTLYVLEPTLDELPSRVVDAHGFDPARMLGWLHASGASLPRLRVLGCEPGHVPDFEVEARLSEPVAAAVDEAVEMALRVLADLRAKEHAES